MIDGKTHSTKSCPDTLIFRVFVGNQIEDRVMVRVIPIEQGDVWQELSYQEWLEMKKPHLAG